MVAGAYNACKTQLKLNKATNSLYESSHTPEWGVIGKNWNYVRRTIVGQ